MSDVLRVINEKQCKISEVGINAKQIAEIIKLIDEGKISSKIAKTVFDEVISSGKNPSVIVEEKGLIQISDSSEIEKAVQDVIDANPKEVERYKNGEKKLQGFFVGQVMRATKGKANPKVVNELLAKLIK
jgi:aspartyl-tRNA(Asn)/glutamyl-tRNA(Gln) amidotransferase subunit B